MNHPNINSRLEYYHFLNQNIAPSSESRGNTFEGKSFLIWKTRLGTGGKKYTWYDFSRRSKWVLEKPYNIATQLMLLIEGDKAVTGVKIMMS